MPRSCHLPCDSFLIRLRSSLSGCHATLPQGSVAGHPERRLWRRPFPHRPVDDFKLPDGTVSGHHAALCFCAQASSPLNCFTAPFHLWLSLYFKFNDRGGERVIKSGRRHHQISEANVPIQLPKKRKPRPKQVKMLINSWLPIICSSIVCCLKIKGKQCLLRPK